MARQIHWRMPFTALDGTQYVAEIYHEGYEGEVVTLRGSDNPFIVSDKADDDFFNPFILSTGYISFIKTDELDNSIYPTSAKSHFVKLIAGSNVIWTGYIKPETYSQPWDTTPYTIDLPIQDQLSVMMSGELSISNYETERILDILRDKVFNTLVEYKYVVFPYDWAKGKNYPLLTKVIGSAWTDNGKEIPVQTFLEDILNFWNISLRAQGDTLYFIGHHNAPYNKWTWADFMQNAESSEEVTSSSLDISDLQVATDDGEASIIPPYKKVVIEANIKSSKELGGITTDELKYMSTYTIRNVFGSSIGNTCRVMFYDTPNQYMQFYSYGNEDGSQVLDEDGWKPIAWKPKSFVNWNDYTATANWVRADLFNIEDINKTKRSYHYTDYIILSSYTSFYMDMYDFRNIRPAKEKLHDYPLARLHISDCFHAYNGCLKISVSQIYAPDENWTYLMELFCVLKVGNKYWNGEAWTTQKTVFSIDLNTENEIVSNKTIDMLYENADSGYIIPIKETLFGPVDLFFTLQNGSAWISGLDLSYCQVENYDLKKKENDDSIKHEKLISSDSQDEKTIKNGIVSFDKDRYGLNTIYDANDNPLQRLTNNWSGRNYTPEDATIETAVHDLSFPREKIAATFYLADINPLTSILSNGKKYNIATMDFNFRGSEMTLNIIETRQFRNEEINTTLRNYQNVFDAVSMAATMLWPYCEPTNPIFETETFQDWLFNAGVVSGGNGVESTQLISTIERLYPEAAGAYDYMERHEDRICGIDFVDVLCEHLGIKHY